MWIALLSLLCSPALGAKVDRAPSGAIVTVRPEPELEERAWLIDKTNQPVLLPEDMPESMWLVHPQVYRQMVAAIEGGQVRDPLDDEQAKIIANLETDLVTEKRLRSELRIDLESCQASRTAENKALRRSRTHWAIGTGVIGALVGGGAIALVAL